MTKEGTVAQEVLLSERERNQLLYGFFARVPRTSLVRDFAGRDLGTILDVIGERKDALDQAQFIPQIVELLSHSFLSHYGKKYVISDFEACFINGVYDDVPGYAPELEGKFELYRMNEGEGIFSVRHAMEIEIALYNTFVQRINGIIEVGQDPELLQRAKNAVALREKENFYLQISKALMPEEERQIVERRAEYEAYYEKISKKLIDDKYFLPKWRGDIENTHRSKLVAIPL